MPFRTLSRVNPRNHVLDGDRDSQLEGAILKREGMPQHVRRYSDVSCVKTTEPIEMPFGLWTRVGRRKHVLHVRAHWRRLANTTEPSVCGGDAALCQITLTTCYYWNFLLHLCLKRKSVVESVLLVAIGEVGYITPTRAAWWAASTIIVIAIIIIDLNVIKQQVTVFRLNFSFKLKF